MVTPLFYIARKLDNIGFKLYIKFMLSTQLKSITDLRTDPFAVTQLARDEGPVYILNRNKPVGVMLDIKAYESLIDQLQDATDMVEIKARKKVAKPGDFISHEQLFSELGV